MLNRFFKAVAPVVPAYKISDFMAKYDGKFVRLNCFNTLYDDFEPYIIDILPALKDRDSYQFLHIA